MPQTMSSAKVRTTSARVFFAINVVGASGRSGRSTRLAIMLKCVLHFVRTCVCVSKRGKCVGGVRGAPAPNVIYMSLW
eukprot:4511204-Pyramimonas_sp.AAC.1